MLCFAYSGGDSEPRYFRYLRRQAQVRALRRLAPSPSRPLQRTGPQSMIDDDDRLAAALEALVPAVRAIAHWGIDGPAGLGDR